MTSRPIPRSLPARAGSPGDQDPVEQEHAEDAAQAAVASPQMEAPPVDAVAEGSSAAPATDDAGSDDGAAAGPTASSTVGHEAAADAAWAGGSTTMTVAGGLGALGLIGAAAAGGGGSKDSSPTPPSGQKPDVPKPDPQHPGETHADGHTPTDPTKPDGHTPTDPTKPDGHTPTDPTKPDGHTPTDPTKPDGHTPTDPTKPDGHTPTDPTKPDEHTPTDPTKPDEHTPDPQQPDGETPDQPPHPQPVPLAPGLSLLNDTGTSATDHLTKDATVKVEGITAGNSWKYSVDGGTTWVAGSADHLVPAASFLSDGTQHVSVVQTNASGVSSEAAELVFELDRTAPVGVPQIALVFDSWDPFIAPENDRISNKGDLSVSGLDSASAWTYSIDGGDWQRGEDNHLIPEAAFGPDGHHTVQVKQVDEAGNEGAVSAYDFTLDRHIEIPTVTFAHSAIDANGTIVTNGGDLLIGSLEQNGYFSHRLNSNQGFLARTDLADGGNPVMLDLSDIQVPAWGQTLRQGENTLEIFGADMANNWSADTRITFIYDTVAPDRPAVSLKHDDGASSTEGITSDATLTIGGLETLAKWKYSLDAGKTWTQGAGTELAASAITGAGEHTVQVVQTDLAGNDSTATVFTFTLDPSLAPINAGPVI